MSSGFWICAAFFSAARFAALIAAVFFDPLG
jgi:hypothetical protein